MSEQTPRLDEEVKRRAQQQASDEETQRQAEQKRLHDEAEALRKKLELQAATGEVVKEELIELGKLLEAHEVPKKQLPIMGNQTYTARVGRLAFMGIGSLKEFVRRDVKIRTEEVWELERKPVYSDVYMYHEWTGRREYAGDEGLSLNGAGQLIRWKETSSGKNRPYKTEIIGIDECVPLDDIVPTFEAAQQPAVTAWHEKIVDWGAKLVGTDD